MYLKVEAQLVNGDCVLSGIVLHNTSEEGMREEEPRDPEQVGLAVVIPFLKPKDKRSVNLILSPKREHSIEWFNFRTWNYGILLVINVQLCTNITSYCFHSLNFI